MKDKTHGRGYSLKYISFLLIILLSGSLLYWISVRCGINLTYDSTEYIEWAGKGILFQRSVNPWPPLFSLTIYMFHVKFNISYEFIQYALMTVNFWLLVLLGERTLANITLRLIWLAIVFTGVSLMVIHVFLWSEPLFVVLLLSIIIFLDRYLKKQEWPYLLLLILFSNLLCLQRNAGIFFVAGTAAALLWYLPEKKRFFVAFMLLVTGSLSFIAWNFVVPGFSSGLVRLSGLSYFEGLFFNIGAYLNTISEWFIPRFIYSWIRIVLLLSGLMIIIAGKLYPRTYRDPAGTIVLFIIIYFTGIAVLGKIDVYESERYLAVMYPLFILFIFKSIGSLFGRINHRMRMVIYALIILWLFYVVARTAINAERWEKASCSAITVK